MDTFDACVLISFILVLLLSFWVYIPYRALFEILMLIKIGYHSYNLLRRHMNRSIIYSV